MCNMGNMSGPDCHCEHVDKLLIDMNTVRLDIDTGAKPKSI